MIVVGDSDGDGDASRFQSIHNDDDEYCTDCTICFGLSSDDQMKCILPVIEQSLSPYCQSSNADNYLMREVPTVNIPWLIAVRAYCAIASAKWYVSQQTDSFVEMRFHTAEEVYARIKEHIRGVSLVNAISKTLQNESKDTGTTSSSELDRVDLSDELHKEESGYLGVHILCLPSCNGGNNGSIIPPSLIEYIQQNIKQIEQSQSRIINPRKRFRGNDPTLKQGGDPRNNLELRVRRLMNEEDKSSNSLIMIIPWLEKSTVLQWIDGQNDSSLSTLVSWLRQLHKSKNGVQQCTIHAATFRRPFYIQGTYTKSRRDISQTPFYVPSSTKESKAMVRKGVSSVEDEICPMIATGCGCISTANNNNEPILPTKDKLNDTSTSNKGAVVYGLCKFHASGREILMCGCCYPRNQRTYLACRLLGDLSYVKCSMLIGYHQDEI